MSDTKVSETYYLTHSGKVTGPFTKAQLKLMAERGEIQPADLVSRDGTGGMPAAKVKGLLPQVPPTTPETTPPPRGDAPLSLDPEPAAEPTHGTWASVKAWWQRLTRNQKFAVGGGLVVVLLILSASAKRASRPAADSPDAAEQAVRVSAVRLFEDYESNEVGADAKYKGKLVEVTGTIDIVKAEYIALNEHAGQFTFGWVHVHLSRSDRSKLGGLRKGQSITVRGTCMGKRLGPVDIQDAVLVSP